MLATAKCASRKKQKYLKPHGTSGFRQYSPIRHCIKDEVKIDPPYNTGTAFAQYDDNFEHSLWLNLMYRRIELLSVLLSKDGSIWITLDDSEAHYCKILCDEIFGRNNFIADIVWEKADSPKMDAKLLSSRHDHILLYAKDIDAITIHKIVSNDIPKHYNKTDADGRQYYLKPLRAMGVDGYREKRPALYFPIEAPDGEMVYPKNQDGSDSRWRWSKEKVEKDKSLLEWVNGKNGWSLYFRIYWDNSEGTPPETIWKQEDVGSNRTSKKESKELFDVSFDTPKPERLIQRVLGISTNPGDLVLDSFLGSGTTAAVAQKMGRRWIGIEMGDHAYTHCKTRLDQVIDGADAGGVTKATGWQRDGGYRFYELAPTLILRDAFGEAVISDQYNAEQLAAAVAFHEGCTYQPDAEVFWKQAVGAEKSYLFTTTRPVTAAYLDAIAAEMQPGEFLTIAATSFAPELAKVHKRIALRQIPEMLLAKCAFGVDNYNLPIIDPPTAEEGEEGMDDEIG